MLRNILLYILMVLAPLFYYGKAGAFQDAGSEQLRGQAQKLKEAVSRCQSRLASGELSRCKVQVTFEGNRVVTMDEAESIAERLEREADEIFKQGLLDDQLKLAQERIAQLRKETAKIQLHLRMLTKDLLINNSEFETWQKTVDDSYNNVLSSSKEYIFGLFLDYGLGKAEDLYNKKVLYKKLDELVNTQDPRIKEWLGKEYLKRKIDADTVKKAAGLIASGGDLKSYIEGLFGDISQDNQKQLDSLVLAADLFNILDVKYKDSLGVIKKVQLPLQHARMVGIAYTELGSICYSWYKINKLEERNDGYIREVKALSWDMKNKMEEITCLEGCAQNDQADCMAKNCSYSRFHIPPPPIPE